LQSQVGRRLGLRFTPELRFEIDPSIAAAARVEELLRETQPTAAAGPDDAEADAGERDDEERDDDA
jgi:hypothetical protein